MRADVGKAAGPYVAIGTGSPSVSERFGPVDFDRFHTVDLPERLDGSLGDAVAAATRGLSPIAFRLEDGRAYTFVPGDGGLAVVPGDDEARTVVALGHAAWCDFMWEIRTSCALLYAGAVSFPRGGFGHLARWEPALRAAFDGQAVYDLDDPPPVLDAAGQPLELGRSFTLDDGDPDVRDHLDRAGFVHLRGVFSPAEVAELSAVADTAVAGARPDDNRSWWTTVDGRDVCNRVNYLNEQSTVVARLGDDDRLRRIGALGGPHLRDAADRLDGHNLVVKVPGASTGLADLPWHRDCGMGGHPVKCPLLNVGIQLDAATAAAGQLHLIAGSHRGTSPVPTDDQVDRLPTAAITTEPGDVTVHYGHVLHAAPPPADRTASGRRAIYVTFVPPLTFDMVGPGQGYNDVLFSYDAGRVRHIDELA